MTDSVDFNSMSSSSMQSIPNTISAQSGIYPPPGSIIQSQPVAQKRGPSILKIGDGNNMDTDSLDSSKSSIRQRKIMGKLFQAAKRETDPQKIMSLMAD